MTKPLKTDQERVAELVAQTQAQQIAGLALMGGSEAGIAKQMNITRHRVRRIMAGDEFKGIMDELATKATDFAVKAFRAKINSLEPLAFAALKANLEDHKIEAVKLWGQYAGLASDEGEKAQQSLTVIMPGAQAPETVQVVESVVSPKSDSEELQ